MIAMPFKSKKQQSWMWAKKPRLAAKWTKKYGAFGKRKRRKKRRARQK